MVGINITILNCMHLTTCLCCPPSPQVRLVLEFCDCGSLHDQLNDNVMFFDEFDRDIANLNYKAVLDIAADVAKGMLHLHSLNVVHGDLKVRAGHLSSQAAAKQCILLLGQVPPAHA